MGAARLGVGETGKALPLSMAAASFCGARTATAVRSSLADALQINSID
jgi:hypothetical protein